MKSREIKNWRYILSYDQIANLEDFPALLLEAVSHDSCLMCGGTKVMNDGLCFECGRGLNDSERKASELVLKNYRVGVSVEKIA